MTTFSIKYGRFMCPFVSTWKLAQLCESLNDYILLLFGISEVKWAYVGELYTPNRQKLMFSVRASGRKS